MAGCYSLVVVVQQSLERPYAAELGRRSLRDTAQRESLGFRGSELLGLKCPWPPLWCLQYC